jgi:uncharacterized protein YndB with AHSA1/START domain
MKWIFRILILVILLAGIAFAIGYALPAHHSLTRIVVLKQTPDSIFAALADLPNMPSWNRGVKKIEMLPPIDGKEASRQTMDGNMVMTVITSESSPPNHLVRTIGDNTAPFSGSWTYEITPAADGTQVILTESATVPNPIFRLMVKVSGPAKHLDEHLTDLAKHFGETATPQ